MSLVDECVKQVCPECQETLKFEAGLFHCEQHGDFFKYGSQLLVRAALGEAELGAPEHLMPWEKMRDKQF